MMGIGISVKEADGWKWLERHTDGRTAENCVVKEYDFALRVVLAQQLNLSSLYVYDIGEGNSWDAG